MHAGKMAYLEHDGVLAFAHRGGDRVAPENTMAAFAAAVAQGYLSRNRCPCLAGRRSLCVSR